MKTANRCCCMYTEFQLSIRTVSNYCSLLFFALVLTASSWFIQNAAAQAPSGTLKLVGPSTDPAPDEEFVVSVEIADPQNVRVFSMNIEYPDAVSLSPPDAIQPGEGQFDIDELTIEAEQFLLNGRVQRRLVLGINDHDISEGTLLTIKLETSEIGNHRIEIIGQGGHTELLNSSAESVQLADHELPRLTVPVRPPLQGTVSLVPAVGIIPPEHINVTGIRVGEASFIDIELRDRSRVHRYEITIDASEKLGILMVSYNADDTNGTVITSHNPVDPMTFDAELSRPNDPIDDSDLVVAYGDHIVATVFFTPTDAGEASFEITAAKIYMSDTDTDGEDATLLDTNPLTFAIAEASPQVTEINTGIGPTPIITVEGGTANDPFNGPFEVEISFRSENYIKHTVNDEASILVQRGVYGFARDEVVVSGAGASVTTRFKEIVMLVNRRKARVRHIA